MPRLLHIADAARLKLKPVRDEHGFKLHGGLAWPAWVNEDTRRDPIWCIEYERDPAGVLARLQELRRDRR